MKLEPIKDAIVKHLLIRNYKPYERILRHLREQGDVWMVSQGEYMSWWLAREKASLRIAVSGRVCQASTSLENAVVEKFPGEFLDPPIVRSEEVTFSGEVWITIDSALERKDLLIELLTREGILNFRTAQRGEFTLSPAEIGPLLEKIETKLRERGRLFEKDVQAVRQVIIDKLAARGLPLLRLWYHPRLDGVVMRAVFSPRYDVDRAITNLAHIRKLENKYGVSSTLYLRAFCPFYDAKAIKKLAAMPWCSEIGLHGEFSTHARKYGDEFKAAIAEKEHLEKLIGRPVWGVCMHGGELTANTDKNTPAVVQNAALLYDTTQTMYYHLPFKKMVNGQLSKSYTLVHPLGDVKLPPSRDYGRVFYETTIAKMDEIREQGGIFVLLLHPVYFGFFRYLFNPRNWGPFIRFFWRYFRQSQKQS